MAPNVNNWARAAQVVTSQNTAIRRKLAEDKPRYDRIGQASVQAAAKNAVNVASNNASTADTAIRAEALMRKTKIGIDEDKKIRGFKKQAKMTGMLAGGAALVGGMSGVATNRPIKQGLIRGLGGLAVGQIGGNLIEGERRRRNQEENELNRTQY